jgi:hypothetical protein
MEDRELVNEGEDMTGNSPMGEHHEILGRGALLEEVCIFVRD